MRQKTIQTKQGKTTYYIMTDTYENMISFHVKFPDELQENEFVVPKEIILSEEVKDMLVVLFGSSYEKGRQRGRWEKAKKLGELFNALKRESLGA